jgi:tetratricopeptide (TPR) repeat protein
MCARVFSAVLALVLAASPSLQAQDLTHIEGLGSLSFPNSGAAEAQQDFIRGVLLLHSFEYGFAAEAFNAAQEIDPDFAMAYWGEAMTYTHPVWNEKDPESARAALARYAPTPTERAAKASTDRERAYLEAVDVLYGDGPKEVLDTLYSRAMADLAAAYPDDLEAQTFYALSLLGLSQGDRNVPTYMEAGAIALAAFQKNKDHPGAAHYTIHSFDDPTHAILAMEAARLYGPMAPDAGHAQHMTTHIFLARGMWDDVVAANINADAVTDRNLARRDLPPTDCGHYNEWLMYGYQQQGRYEDSEALLMGCFRQAHDERLPEGMRQAASRSYTYMRSLNLADTRNHDGEPAHSTVELGEGGSVSHLMQAWGSGIAALNRGDPETAETHHRFLLDNRKEEQDWVSPYVPVWTGTLSALMHAHAGDTELALEAATAAAEYEASLPVDFGPPIAFKPARELEGEILLSLGRPDQAMSAFETQLGRTPNRILTVAGYARAAVAAGHNEVALGAYRVLSELLVNADGGMPEAAEARAFLSSKVGRRIGAPTSPRPGRTGSGHTGTHSGGKRSSTGLYGTRATR